jgi:ribonuclease HI
MSQEEYKPDSGSDKPTFQIATEKMRELRKQQEDKLTKAHVNKDSEYYLQKFQENWKDNEIELVRRPSKGVIYSNKKLHKEGMFRLEVYGKKGEITNRRRALNDSKLYKNKQMD